MQARAQPMGRRSVSQKHKPSSKVLRPCWRESAWTRASPSS